MVLLFLSQKGLTPDESCERDFPAYRESAEGAMPDRKGRAETLRRKDCGRTGL